MSNHRIISEPANIDLNDYDTADTGDIKQKDAAAAQTKLEKRLVLLQELLYAAGKQSVLIVLQGMDTAGKDGTIKHVMSAVNPVGCHVWSFKQPTPDEVAHDFLWRIHARTPALGMLHIFNRSHYEDVLVARVHKLVPREVWEARYDQINHFEQLLAQNGTIIFKFFLHLSKAEQKRRLLAREDDRSKAWKLSATDWKERELWHDYEEAYADAVGKCATKHAPWCIVPADHKWYRNYFIAQQLVERLEPLAKTWEAALEARGKAELAALQAMHRGEDQA
ncbi:MAG: polyphosphate kinase 2 family protein [Ktedonobacterales bacterium]|nr:polyphosphate kinase 2 family protein [Ktedonobacterales bacterium]